MDGGFLMMDLPGREVLANDYMPVVRYEVPEMGCVTEHRKVSTDWKQLNLTWRYMESNRSQRISFKLWLYSGDEIRKMLKDAGFSNIKLYGGFDRRAYDHSARQLIVSAQKSTDM